MERKIEGDNFDAEGVPPPKEDITSFYIIIKNLCPVTAWDDAWEAFRALPGKLVMDMGEMSALSSEDGKDTNMYINLGGVNSGERAAGRHRRAEGVGWPRAFDIRLIPPGTNQFRWSRTRVTTALNISHIPFLSELHNSELSLV